MAGNCPRSGSTACSCIWVAETGTAKPVPYAYGAVQLDGADTQLSHFIEYKDESKLQIGARVETVFEEVRKGNIKDIKAFRLIEE